MIKNPEIEFPQAFEVYDPKVTNTFKVSPGGLTGTKSIEIMFIPRHAGTFEIPAYKISYFDLSEGKYKSISTQAYTLQVLKSDGTVEESVVVGNYSRKEDVKQLGSDIRYIYTGKMNLQKEVNYRIDEFGAWMMYLLPALLAVILFIVFRKQVRENANVSLMKNKRANRIARKRLKVALGLLKAGNTDRFYEELMKGIWTYLSDKLSIPVAELTKEKVEVELLEKQVNKELIVRCLNVLNECEFARFAPNAGQKHRDQLYDEAATVISELENEIKN